MATQRSTVAHILEAAAGAGAVRARAMFGEYALYCDDKVVALICDDTLFLKDTPGARGLIEAPDLSAPYPRAKPQIVADALLDDPGQSCLDRPVAVLSGGDRGPRGDRLLAAR